MKQILRSAQDDMVRRVSSNLLPETSRHVQAGLRSLSLGGKLANQIQCGINLSLVVEDFTRLPDPHILAL